MDGAANSSAASHPDDNDKPMSNMSPAPLASREQSIDKEDLLGTVHDRDTSALEKYGDFFVGRRDLGSILRYELLTCILGSMPGAAGLLLRKRLYGRLFRSVGHNVVFGRNITFRHPGSISIGDGTAIDNNCHIDARGGGDEGIKIGKNTLIASTTTLVAKSGPIVIGDDVSISSHCSIASVSGIFIGSHVGIAGHCFIGGGRYYYEDKETPIMKQGVFSKGPVEIEDDVWIGAGCRIMDGVRIGKGSIVGAGAVVQEDIPPYTVAAPFVKLVKMPR